MPIPLETQISVTPSALSTKVHNITVEGIVAAMAGERYKAKIEELRKVYGEAFERGGLKEAKKAASPLKKDLPGILWSGTFTGRGDDKLETYSHLICADLDNLEPEALAETAARLRSDKHVHTFFLSPTGTGLKLVFSSTGDATQHSTGTFWAVQQYVQATYGLEIDSACRNLERLCFISYDPEIAWNADAIPLEPLAEESGKPKPSKTAPAKPKPPEEEPALNIDLDARAAIAEEVFGTIDWESDTEGFAECPGIESHTSADAPKDFKVFIGGRVPAVTCFHQSCKEAVAAKVHEFRSKVAKAEWAATSAEYIILPSGSVTFSECAAKLFAKVAPTHTLFMRGGALVELVQDGKGDAHLEPVNATAFRSRVEQHGQIMAWRVGRDGAPVLKPSQMSVDCAGALMATLEARETLPALSSVVRCPILTEDAAGKLIVLGKGYHPELGGVLVTHGKSVPVVGLEDAKHNLLWMINELSFQTEGDRSRALAAKITPALKLGGLIKGSCPLDVMEADQPQSGKGYTLATTAAVYNEAAYFVQQRKGGVGSTDESFASALVSGRPFVSLDNVRGELDSPYMESFLTMPEGSLFAVRIPGQREAQIDPSRFVLQLTSNGMQSTPDLAQRASICRILKRPGVTFEDRPQSVRDSQALVLGSVFAVIRAWHEAGKPRTSETRHAFKEWCQVLDWIVQSLLGCAPLMDGHEALQERVSNPALVWLRAVAIAVSQEGRLDAPLTASDLAEICQGHGIAIPGLRSHTDEKSAARVIGGLGRRLFNEGSDRVTVENYTAKRGSVEYKNPSGDWGEKPTYTISKNL